MAIAILRRIRAARSVSTAKRAGFHSVCVFCGSSRPSGERGEEYMSAAVKLGEALASKGIRLVYGGGSVGLMGAIAHTVDERGGEVKGVIPAALKPRELSGEGVQPQNVVVTETMHERKAIMASSSSAFIAMPGGFGTFEELLEVITWSQLGVHNKPVGLLNVGGFYDSLIGLFEHASKEGFIRPDNMDIVVVDTDPERLVERLREHQLPPAICNWSVKV